MSSPTSVDEAADLVVGPWHVQSSEGPTVLMSRIYCCVLLLCPREGMPPLHPVCPPQHHTQNDLIMKALGRLCAVVALKQLT